MTFVRALTSRTNPPARRNAIITEIGICLPFTPESGVPIQHAVQQFDGVWDTGATGTVITKKIVDVVGLTPTGQTIVSTAGGQVTQNTYLVNLTLPMGLMLPNLTVTEGDLSGVDALIGNRNHARFNLIETLGEKEKENEREF